MTLLSKEVETFIRSRPWPERLRWQVSEYEGYLLMTFFRDNFSSLDGEEQKHVASVVQFLFMKIRGDGIPIYLEVAAGDGHDRG